MYHKVWLHVVCIIGCCQIPLSHAHHSADSALHCLFSVGLTSGGDNLVTEQYSDGSKRKVEAGSLLYFAGGIAVAPPDSPIDLQFSLGYFFDIADADNGTARISRFPLEMISYYRFQKHRFGLGISHHLATRFSVDTRSVDDEVRFKTSVGWVLEYNYQITRQIALGVRYVDMEYRSNNSDRPLSLDASHAGILATFLF